MTSTGMSLPAQIIRQTTVSNWTQAAIYIWLLQSRICLKNMQIKKDMQLQEHKHEAQFETLEMCTKKQNHQTILFKSNKCIIVK